MNILQRKLLSRRTLLRQSGVALALPLLESMQVGTAAEKPAPQRFLGILNYFSFHAPNLFPAEQGKGYTSTPYLKLIEEHRDDFTIISGLNNPDVRDGHASDKSFFTGAAHPSSPAFRNTISVDQVVAEQLGRKTRIGSLHLATSAGFSCSYTRNGVAIPSDSSPAKVFAKLFIDGTQQEVAAEVERIREGKSILDRVRGQAKSLEGSLTPGDREKMDQYFTSVRELEQRLKQAEEYARLPKPKPGTKLIEDPGPGEELVRFGNLLDVARLALATDLTRIVTMYYVGTSKTPSQPGTSFPYHELSHHGQDAGKLERLAILERDLISQWGLFVGRMKETREGNARLLDRTMVVFGAAMGNASSHDATNLPILVAGGGFRHGQHVQHDVKNPPPLCNLWVQVLNHMGVPAERFGSSRGSGIPGLEARA